MKKIAIVLLAVMLVSGTAMLSCSKQEAPKKQTIYDFKEKNITDSPARPVDFSQYKGKVLLIVNTASQCGYTPQYAKLQDLYIKYNAQGLEILAFPSNSFNQEPLPDEEIVLFCQDNFRVSFPMFIKISVTGADIHPLYAYLTSPETNTKCPGEVKWNFEKFLIGKDGEIIGRYDSKTEPDDPAFVGAIEAALAQ